MQNRHTADLLIYAKYMSAAGQLHQVTSQRSTGRRKRNASENPPGQMRFLASKVCFGVSSQVDDVQKIPMISPENNPKFFPIRSPRSRMIILEFLRSGWMCFFFQHDFGGSGLHMTDRSTGLNMSHPGWLCDSSEVKQRISSTASVTVSLV